MTLRELMKWGMDFQMNRIKKEDLKIYERLICSEACPHCDPLNSFCWRSWNYIKPYDLCREGIQIDEEGNLAYPVGEE